MKNKVIYKDIWVNAYPIVIWLSMEPIAGLVDVSITGTIGINSLSAVGIGTTIYFVTTWLFIFLAYGTTPYVADLNINKKFSSLNYFILFGRRVSVYLGIAVFIIVWLFDSALIDLFKPTIEVKEFSSTYLIARSLGIGFFLLNMHSTAVLRGLRFPKYTTLSSLISTVLNIFFSFLLGIIFNFGVLGVGLASTISFLVASIYSTYILNIKIRTLEISVESIDKEKIRRKFFNVGSRIFVRSVFLTFFMATLSNQASRLSMNDIALHHVLQQMWNISYTFVDALAISAQTLVAEYVAKNKNFIKSNLRKCFINLTFSISIILSIIFYFGIEFLSEFVSNQSFIQLNDKKLVFVFCLTIFFGYFAFLWDGILLGLDKSKEFSYITIFGSISGFVALFALLNYEESLLNIWVALILSLIVRASFGYYYENK